MNVRMDTDWKDRMLLVYKVKYIKFSFLRLLDNEFETRSTSFYTSGPYKIGEF